MLLSRETRRLDGPGDRQRCLMLGPRAVTAVPTISARVWVQCRFANVNESTRARVRATTRALQSDRHRRRWRMYGSPFRRARVTFPFGGFWRSAFNPNENSQPTYKHDVQNTMDYIRCTMYYLLGNMYYVLLMMYYDYVLCPTSITPHTLDLERAPPTTDREPCVATRKQAGVGKFSRKVPVPGAVVLFSGHDGHRVVRDGVHVHAGDTVLDNRLGTERFVDEGGVRDGLQRHTVLQQPLRFPLTPAHLPGQGLGFPPRVGGGIRGRARTFTNHALVLRVLRGGLGNHHLENLQHPATSAACDGFSRPGCIHEQLCITGFTAQDKQVDRCTN